MEELLSVVVPVYNKEKYLEECINSILNQTYSNLEIILVDDGSTDQSGKICDRYEQEYENIKVIHCENGGITKARLRGVELSRGSKVTFVDADDWIDKDYYTVACVGNSNIDIIITGENKGNDKEGFRQRKFYLQEGVYNHERIIQEIAPSMMWDSIVDEWKVEPSLCTKIFERNILLKELHLAERIRCCYGEDTVVLYPLMLQVSNIKVIKKAFYNYRIRPIGEFPEYVKDENFISKVLIIYQYLIGRFSELGSLNLMKVQLDSFLISSVNMKKMTNGAYRFAMTFPFQFIEKGSNVVIYGAGRLGNEYIKQNMKYNFCNIVLWVDKDYERFTSDDSLICISPVSEIRHIKFDYIVIAIDKYSVAYSVMEKLGEYGIGKDKIVWQSTRCCTFNDC